MEVKALLTLDTPNPGVQQSGQSGARGTDSISAQAPGCPGSWWDMKAPERAAGAEPTPSIVLRSPSPAGCPVDPTTVLHPQPWASALWILGAAEGAEKARAPVPAVPSLPCGDSLLKPISSLSARDAGCSEEAQSGQVAWMGERRLGMK